VARAEREADGKELSDEILLPVPRGSLRATETSGPSWCHRDFPLVKEPAPHRGNPLALALRGGTGDVGLAAQVGILFVSEWGWEGGRLP